MNCKYCNQQCLNSKNNVCSKCSTSGKEYRMVDVYERGFIDGANSTYSQALLEGLEEQKQEILEKYNKFLIKNGYADDDFWNR